MTVVMYLFIIQEIKEKTERKREIKSKKINKNKNKNPRVKVYHNMICLLLAIRLQF